MAKVYTGTSGYHYNIFFSKKFENYTPIPGKIIKSFYDNTVKPSNALESYSKHFEIVEINNTFYKLPTKNIIIKWYNQTPPNFKFILKFSRYATHAKKLANFSEYFEEFWNDNVEHLKEKCLGILIQLGPSFVNSNKKSKIDGLTPFERLIEASKYLKKRALPIKYFIEFRHNTWFNVETFNKIKNLGFYPVCVNVGCTEDFSGLNTGYSPELNVYSNLNLDFMYIRCHGPWKSQAYHGGYKQEDLMKIVSLATNTKNLFIMFDNTDTLEGQVEYFYENKIMFNNNILNQKTTGQVINLLPHCVLNAKQIQELVNGKYTDELWIDS